MMELRLGADRGHAQHGWLDSFHSFSFAGYQDPEHMGFGPLRVINEDRIAPGTGFGTHGHRDMEIISYVLEGALAHKDSMGNGSVIRPGDVQRMSAGTGVQHSEFNHEKDATTHFLQIWIEPDRRGITPGYEERHFDAADKRGRLRLIASSDGRDGSVKIHQDAEIHAAILDGDAAVQREIPADRRVYVHVARGEVAVNGTPLAAGDAAKLVGERQLSLTEGRSAEVLVFVLP
jgi:quercetin 2,3-dioxygenase